MNELQMRSLLYGSAVLVLAGIGVGSAVVGTDADVMTLLSSVDVQLRMAHVMPERDVRGKALDARAKMIADAEAQLVTVERLQPGMAVTAEFEGFARMLRGRFDEAAACYQRARQCADCTAEQRDVLTFNQARMLARAGSREAALDTFAANGPALDARFAHQRCLEEATILRELGRRVEAERRLDQVGRDASAAPMASLQAGLEYEQLGHDDKAHAAFERAAASVPIADYHLARLKLRRGEVDTCMQLLERVAKVLPAEVRRRIQDEPEAWRAVAAETRFQQLAASQLAAPGR